uniref:FBA_2 domain-containing protein n=1 Tax=Caenorhabditis tropicalis TaxID=1561998 RepID=A0A1I7UD38_9PELO
MSTQFRLLEVTDVVFDEIVNQLELNEIFYLSLCSHKTMNTVRCHLRKSIKYPLFVDTSAKNAIIFGYIRDKKRVNIISVQDIEMYNGEKLETVYTHDREIEISKHKDHYAMFASSEDEQTVGYCLSLFHITHLFRNDIHTLYCNHPCYKVFVMLKYSESLRMTYVVRAKGQPLYALKDYELEESAKTNGLQLCSFLPRGYDFTLKRDYDYIRVEKAMYASLESVLQLSERSKEVILDDSILISKGLNNFFNHWLQKRIDGLKFLSIRMEAYREFSVYKGIEQRISDATEEINYKSYTGDLYRLSPGKYLRRDDGVIASFFYNPSTRILNFGVVSKTK